MKIRAKITLFTSLFLMLMVALLTFFSIQNIQKQGEVRLKNYKDDTISDVKDHLKDLVDVAYETIEKNYKNLSDINYLSKFYERRLQGIINTAEIIVKRHQKMVLDGKTSLTQAKNRAQAEIKELRFDGGTGYIWINDTTRPYPKMVMHPISPDLDGKILNNEKYNSAQGIKKNLFIAFLDVTSTQGDGYVDYLWPKPTADGLTEQKPKLSYVKRFDEWNWIIGTGIYIDDAHIDIENRIKETVKSMRYANGTGYFWINDDTLPYPKMIMHPTVPSLDGTVLDDPKYNNALGIDKNLFTAFTEITAQNGDGFVDYLWPKPTPNGLSERKEKISYVKLHTSLGWIIGSGAYIDNIDEIVAAKKLKIDEQIFSLLMNNLIASLIFITLAIVISFLFSNTLAKPIRNLTYVSEQISKGKLLDKSIIEVNRKDEIGELAKSVDRLKNSVKIMIDRMTKKQ